MTDPPTPSPDVRPKRRWRFRVIALLLGAGGALVVAEVAMRILDIDPIRNAACLKNYRLNDNPILKYELLPGSRDGKFAISSAGLRDRDYDIPKPPNTFRIMLIGDSVTYGLSCGRFDTLPRQLESILALANPPDGIAIEVLNLGTVGYNITQVVESFRVRGQTFDPDLVVYNYVLNDPQEFSLEAASLQALKRRAEQGTFALPSRLHDLLLNVRCYRALQAVLFQKPKRSLVSLNDDPTWAAESKGKHFDYLRAIHADESSWLRVQKGLAQLARLTIEQRNIPCVVTIFPVDWNVSVDEYPLLQVHQKVAAEIRRHGLIALDLYAPFRAAKDVSPDRLFSDPLHPNGTGFSVVAVALADFLCEKHYLPQSAQTRRRLHQLATDPLSVAVFRSVRGK